MSYRVRKLTVGKGKTTTNMENNEWVKEYYELEFEIPDESEISIAKENAVELLNEWLGVSEAEEKQAKWNWNPQAIKWVEAEGFRGRYERYPAEGVKPEGSKDYWAMLEDLKARNGKLTREGYFYWLFRDGSTVGRKKRVEMNKEKEV